MALIDSLIAPGLFDRLDAIASSLSRIADGLDRVYPPIDLVRLEARRKPGPGAIIRYGRDDKEWAQEQFGSLIHEQGLAPDAEKELLAETMNRWEAAPPQFRED